MIIIAGWVFVVLGIAGLFLPILQGILFLMVGLFLLSKKAPWARRLLNRLRSRYPRLLVQVRMGRMKINRYIRSILGRR